MINTTTQSTFIEAFGCPMEYLRIIAKFLEKNLSSLNKGGKKMKKASYFLLVLAGTTLLLFFLNSSAKSADNVTSNEVGTYSLFKTNEEGKDVLYKINTKTGQVWCYNEYVIMSSEDLGLTGKEKEGLDKLIADAKAKGKNVYTLPFWSLTSDEKSKYYTIK